MEDAHGDDAASRKSAEKQIRKLERSIADQRSIMESSHDIPEFLEVDYQFHEDAIGYLQNPTFDRDLDSITHNIRDLASSSLEHEGRMEKTVEEHQAILDAIKDGKTEALLAAAMRHFRVPKDINLQDVH
jgi:DNA-binding GntR family transcriptional regulator